MIARKIFDRPSYFGLSRKQLQALYLVAATGLAALVPIIFLTGFWVQSELGKSRRDLDIFLGARAFTLSQGVDAEIERQLAALRALATLPALDRDAGGFENAGRRVAGEMPQWSDLALVEPTGRIVFSTGGTGIPVDADLLKRVAAEKRALIEALPSDAQAPGGILLYEPVIRGDIVTHVFALRFGAENLKEILARSTNEDLSSLLVDPKGRILALSPASEDAKTRLEPDLARAVDASPAGLHRGTSSDGEPVTTAFTRSPLTGWISLVSISRSRSDPLFNRPAWATIAGGTVSLLLAGILAVFVTHNFKERRVSDERLASSRALGELDARLLATSREALEDQRRASSEREILLREVYHRVKNNLQIVQSLLRLGSRDLTPDQREPFENAVRRIGAMARVHNLLYNSPDLASIDFKDYLDELLRELSDSFGTKERSVASVLNSEPMRLPLDTVIPLAFIAVEILTNSYKHAFPAGRAGRITVDVERSGDHASLKISDNGIGLTAHPDSRRRLGLTIVRKLVQQIGGQIEEPPPGSSTYIVRFPVNEAAPPPAAETVAQQQGPDRATLT